VDFLARWDRRDESRLDRLPLAVSGKGNINLAGSDAGVMSYLLTRWHPSFEDSIEPGVRALVVQLIRTWDCVTYSSCQGHKAAGMVPARVRHVRLIARSRPEHEQLAGRLQRLAMLTNAQVSGSTVGVAVAPTVVSSEDGVEALGLDLLFEPRGCDEDGYAEAIEAVYEACLRQLREEPQ
jgi:hypothetical protein